MNLTEAKEAKLTLGLFDGICADVASGHLGEAYVVAGETWEFFGVSAEVQARAVEWQKLWQGNPVKMLQQAFADAGYICNDKSSGFIEADNVPIEYRVRVIGRNPFVLRVLFTRVSASDIRELAMSGRGIAEASKQSGGES